MAARAFVALAIVVLVHSSSAGSNFLALPTVKVQELEAVLLAEFSGSVGNSSAAQHLASIEAELRPIFAAVPQERDETLSHNVARYVLQRFFANRQGWFIRGLEPTKAAAMVSSDPSPIPNKSEEALKTTEDWAPAYLQTFLETLVTGRGVSVHELAVLAATIENLVHKEEKDHLRQAYMSWSEDTNDRLTPGTAFDVLETYMMIYMLGGNWTAEMAERVERLKIVFGKKVSHWDDTLNWLKKLIDDDTGSSSQGMDFDAALHVVSDIGNRFATFNTEECGRLKSHLLTKESAKPGRIRLVDFYSLGLQGAWEMNEKISFLRDIGTLDETDPTTPLLILPNYVQARTNCLTTSTWYAVCCPNECNHLMKSLEDEIASATARPAQIAKIVTKLSTPTTSVQTISPALMQRLQDIAVHHDGEVPLHGRLFAQWMHHVFPRECPFPHAAGTTSAETADEWMLKTGQADSTLTKEEVLVEVASDTCRLLPKGVQCSNQHQATAQDGEEENAELPWDASEELLVTHETPAPQRSLSQKLPLRSLNDLMFWCFLSSVMYILGWALKMTNAGRRLTLWAGVPLSTSASKPDRCFV